MHSPEVNNEITVPHQYAPGSTPPRASSKSPGGLRTGVVIALTLLLAVVFGTGLFAGWQFGSSNTRAGGLATTLLQPGTGQDPSIPTLTASNLEAVRKAVVAKVRPAVVQVNVATPRGRGLGSGVIIDRRGYMVTNNHVVEGARRLEVVLYDGTKLPAQLVGTDPADDLAVVKITPPKAGLTVATLGDSSKSQVGQEVLAIGNPLGITQTVTNGIISAVGRNVSEEQNGATIPNAIQTDAPINPGNSGGALVDLQGHVIGIPTLTAIDPQFRTPANGVGFAIPSHRVQFIASQLIETGRVTHTGRAALGVKVTSVDEIVAVQHNLSVNHGAFIVSVVPNSPAAQANVMPGEVIVQIESKAVNDVPSLEDALMSKNPGESVSVKVYRGNQQLTLNVKLGELQADT